MFDLFRVGKYIAYLCYSLQICKEILVFRLYYFALALLPDRLMSLQLQGWLLTQNGNKKVEILEKPAQEINEKRTPVLCGY